MKPYPSQIPHIHNLVESLKKHGAAVDLSDTGTGKTVVACSCAKELGLSLFVVCPKSVIPSWKDKAAACGVPIVEVVNYEKLRLRKAWRFNKGFRWPPMPGVLVVFDEAQNMKGKQTLNSKLGLAARQSGNKILLLSATLASNPLEMRASGFILGLHRWGNFWDWAKSYGARENYPFGGFVFDGSPDDLARLHREIIPSRGSRLRAKDMPEFPDNLIIPELVESDPRDIRNLEELVRGAFEEKLAGLETEKEREAHEAARGLTINLALRQRLEKLKVPHILEAADLAHQEGNAVLIFVNFDDTLTEIAEKLGGRCSVIRGGQSPEERAAAIGAFSHNRVPFCVANTKAGGVGVDGLQDLYGVPRVAIHSPDWSAQTLVQNLGRIHRSNAKSKAVQKILFLAGTLEDTVFHAVKSKAADIQTLNDGDLNPLMSTNEPTATILADVQEREHAPYSPSSLGTRSKCCGFRNDETRDKTAAKRGELGHKAVELQDVSIIPEEDPQLREAAEACIIYRKDVAASLGAYVTYEEERFDVLDQWGYLDLVLVNKEHTAAHILDWKFAYGKYEANSPQFWAYCLGVWDRFTRVEKITVHVVMPFRDELDVETFTRQEHYQKFESEVRSIIESSKNPDPAKFSTGRHCEWCALREQCPKLNALAVEVATRYNTDLVIPENVHSSQIADPAQMGLALQLASVLGKWAESVRAHATEMAKNGAEIPGYHLAARRGKRGVSNPAAAYQLVKDVVPLEEFLGKVQVTYSDLEDLFVSKAPRGQKTKRKEYLEDTLRDNNLLLEAGDVQYLTRTKE